MTKEEQRLTDKAQNTEKPIDSGQDDMVQMREKIIKRGKSETGEPSDDVIISPHVSNKDVNEAFSAHFRHFDSELVEDIFYIIDTVVKT